MNQSIMMDFEIVTFWGKFWVRKGIMKWISIILFWTTVMIFGTWLWEYGLILVAPVDFEIITWFGFAWMPDPAGGAGRTFKSRMCTLIILQWQVGFSKRQPGWFFYFHAVNTSVYPSGVIILNNIHHHSKADQDRTNNKISMCFCATLSPLGFHLVGSVVFFSLHGIELTHCCFQRVLCRVTGGEMLTGFSLHKH